MKSDRKNALDVEFDFEGNQITVRRYLLNLLLTLWVEGEGFNGKRPFGNSGWQFDLYAPLIRAGYIKGTLDTYGYVEDVDEKAAHKFVFFLISSLFDAR